MIWRPQLFAFLGLVTLTGCGTPQTLEGEVARQVIAFISSRADMVSVGLISADGKNERQLTRNSVVMIEVYPIV